MPGNKPTRRPIRTRSRTDLHARVQRTARATSEQANTLDTRADTQYLTGSIASTNGGNYSTVPTAVPRDRALPRHDQQPLPRRAVPDTA